MPLFKGVTFSKPLYWVSMLVSGGVYLPTKGRSFTGRSSYKPSCNHHFKKCWILLDDDNTLYYQKMVKLINQPRRNGGHGLLWRIYGTFFQIFRFGSLSCGNRSLTPTSKWNSFCGWISCFGVVTARKVLPQDIPKYWVVIFDVGFFGGHRPQPIASMGLVYLPTFPI